VPQAADSFGCRIPSRQRRCPDWLPVRTANGGPPGSPRENACVLPISLRRTGPRQRPTHDVGALFPWFISCLIKLFESVDRLRHGVRRPVGGCCNAPGDSSNLSSVWSVSAREGGPFLDPHASETPPLWMLRARARSAPREVSPRGVRSFELVSRKRQRCHQGLRQKRAPRRSSAHERRMSSENGSGRSHQTEMQRRSIEQPRRSIPRRSAVQRYFPTGWQPGPTAPEWR